MDGMPVRRSTIPVMRNNRLGSGHEATEPRAVEGSPSSHGWQARRRRSDRSKEAISHRHIAETVTRGASPITTDEDGNEDCNDEAGERTQGRAACHHAFVAETANDLQ